MTVIDLAARRFERLEKAQRVTNERLANIEDTLGRVVTVLEVHTEALHAIADRVDRMCDRVDRVSDRIEGVSDRLDRLTVAIARGRTQDLERLTRVERRLTTLERRRPRRGRTSH
jgi:archaellum component FlaC